MKRVVFWPSSFAFSCCDSVAGSSHTTKTHTTVLAVSGWLTSCLGRRINLLVMPKGQSISVACAHRTRSGGAKGLVAYYRQGTVWGIRWSFSVILTVILTSTRSWFEAIRTGYEDVEGYRDLVKRDKRARCSGGSRMIKRLN
ncbi:hypothetical protein E4T38_04410 [Aureobasidium subglaciale]|nr:hypothetical protein E4T38_04410 [Aureobasidium subglaciale]KAI5224187.1 hypothetical protein E4T40_04186 [Aureobasidium subglaciale]KAI5228293.1 hypothetical protein E4T41_03947 [Aureobasidium subglaciale]KAI5262868.1 hypothetical protein E4T46_04154 [Aureobasidium subglaciale]